MRYSDVVNSTRGNRWGLVTKRVSFFLLIKNLGRNADRILGYMGVVSDRRVVELLLIVSCFGCIIGAMGCGLLQCRIKVWGGI